MKMTQNKKGQAGLDGSLLMKWLIVFGLPIAFYFMPLNLDPAIHSFLAVTLWAVLSWMTTIIPVEATGIAIPCLFVLTGTTDEGTAFASYANTVVWGTAAMILLGVAADKSNIAKRMAYNILLKMDCDLKGLVWGFSIGGLALSFIITDSFARAVIFTTIAVGICRALEIPFKSKEATALGLAAFFGMSGPSILTLTGGNGIQLLSVYRNVVADLGMYDMNYFTWILHNLIPGLAWTLLGVFCILKGIKLGDGRCFDAREELEARKAELGQISRREYCVLVAMILLILDYIVAPGFGLDPFLLAACSIPVLFVPQIGILEREDFTSTADFNILFMMAGAIAIGTVGGSIGVVQMVANLVGPVLGGSSIAMVFGTFAIGALSNFILTPLAIIFSLSEMFANLALTFGFNPLPVMYALNIATDVYAFPYEYAILLVCFSFGIMDYKTTVKVLSMRFVGSFLMVGLICIPYWFLMGLM